MYNVCPQCQHNIYQVGCSRIRKVFPSGLPVQQDLVSQAYSHAPNQHLATLPKAHLLRLLRLLGAQFSTPRLVPVVVLRRRDPPTNSRSALVVDPSDDLPAVGPLILRLEGGWQGARAHRLGDAGRLEEGPPGRRWRAWMRGLRAGHAVWGGVEGWGVVKKEGRQRSRFGGEAWFWNKMEENVFQQTWASVTSLGWHLVGEVSFFSHWELCVDCASLRWSLPTGGCLHLRLF